MPRPKKAGGPEPKKRSRNGCWPCKARKVKCDELHPACQNCLRQGETCDYSIRLNWDGRGSKKKDLDIASAQSVFSSEPVATFDSSSLPQNPASSHTLAQLPLHTPQTTFSNPSIGIPYYGPTQDDHAQRLYRMNSNLSEPLFRPPEMYGRPSFGGQSRSMSYERPRTSLPEGYRSATPRLRSVDDITSSPAVSLGLSSYASFPNTPRALTFMPPTTPPQFTMATENSPGLDFTSSDRAPKRPRYDSIVRSPRSSFMLPPGGLPPISSGMVYNGLTGAAANAVPVASNLNTYGDDMVRLQHPRVSLFSANDPAENARRKPSIESLLSGPSDYASNRSSVSTTRGSFSDGRASFSNFSNPRSSVSDYRGSMSSDPRIPMGDLKTSDVPIPEPLNMYGIDRGNRDFDIPGNSDADAVSAVSNTSHVTPVEPPTQDKEDDVGFAYGVQAMDGDNRVIDYYARPLHITFPRVFEPLPQSLSNPMDLLYFHHFISHTARVLVPNNCSLTPFQSLIPLMALRDKTLMGVLLVYSACHRAKLLRYPVPAQRISLWLGEAMTNISRVLQGPAERVSSPCFVMAILIIALEMLSYTKSDAFHNRTQYTEAARQIIMTREAPEAPQQELAGVMSFLARWFTHMNVISGFTGGYVSSSVAEKLSARYLAGVGACEDSALHADRSLAISMRCSFLLSSVSDLLRLHEEESVNIRHVADSERAQSNSINDHGHQLIQDLERSLADSIIQPIVPSSLPHKQDSLNQSTISLLNAAYHHAGILLLHRRLLGVPGSHPDIQNRVRSIMDCASKTKHAEACLMFPLFAAGCEAREEEQRDFFRKAVLRLESRGINGATRVRTLMFENWLSEDKPPVVTRHTSEPSK